MQLCTGTALPQWEIGFELESWAARMRCKAATTRVWALKRDVADYCCFWFTKAPQKHKSALVNSRFGCIESYDLPGLSEAPWVHIKARLDALAVADVPQLCSPIGRGSQDIPQCKRLKQGLNGQKLVVRSTPLNNNLNTAEAPRLQF